MVRDWRRRKPREIHTRAETVSQTVLDRLAALEAHRQDVDDALDVLATASNVALKRLETLENIMRELADGAEQRLRNAG